MNNRIVLSVIVAVGLACEWPVYAEDAASLAATTEQPWVKAQVLFDATDADFAKGGIMTIGAHMPDLERALADADIALSAADSGTRTITMLTDGPEETLVALTMAASDKNHAGWRTVAVNNPYPSISLYLGSYYNEIGKSQEALRVLDKGLTLFTMQGMALGVHRPLLIAERGAALASLKRWPNALADYDEGLAIEGLEDRDRARLCRGRGYALTELGRLDEAEEAYHESLKLEPDNKIAKGELEYIARLRAGGAAAPSGITLPSKTQ